MSLLIFFQTIIKLGISNVLRVGFYRLSIKYKFNPVFKITSDLLDEPLYNTPKDPNPGLPIVESWENKEINNSFFSLKIQQQPPD